MVALIEANQIQSTTFIYPGDLSGDINSSAVDYQVFRPAFIQIL